MEALADDNFNVAQMMRFFFFFDWVENVVGKVENAIEM